MRITKAITEALKGVYRLGDWNITVKKSTKMGEVLGMAAYEAVHKKAAIYIFPRMIDKERKEFADESQTAVLHHEFAEVVMGAYEELLPEKISSHPAFTKYKDALAEHWSRVVLGVMEEGR